MYCIVDCNVLAADDPGDVGLHDDIPHSGEVPVSRPSSLHYQEQVHQSLPLKTSTHKTKYLYLFVQVQADRCSPVGAQHPGLYSAEQPYLLPGPHTSS